MMAEWILLAVLAASAIIGYRLMSLVDRKIDEYTADDDETEQEKNTDEPSEDGKSECTHTCMSLFFHF